jgi:sugar lactone lactonase YvrE
MGDVAVEVALSVGAQHSEGPIWDAATARLWWIDIAGKRVHRFDPATGDDASWATAEQPGGVVLDAQGDPVVAAPEGLAALDRATGDLAVRVPIEPDRTGNRGNDAKIDPSGRAWVGTMAYDKEPDVASLYRVDGARATRAVDGLTISNGPAFDPARERLYLADTARCIVDVFDLDLETGALANRRRFLDVGDEQVWPDGMTVDDEGMLWTALGRASAVRRYRPDGTLDGVIDLPVTNPTSVAFGGAGRDELYITSSWVDVDPDLRAGQPSAGAVFRCRPGVTGPPSPRWEEHP